MSKAHKWTRHSDLAINRRPVIDRDEYLDHMTFKTNKRPLFTEIFGPIIGLKEEWEAQGATPEELDFSAFNYRAPKIDGIAVNTWRLNAWSKTISETDTVIRYQDDLGRKLTLEKGFASLPLPQSYPVKTMDDWLAIKPRYQFSEARLKGNWERQAKEAREKGEALTLGMPGGFDEPRQLMGEEELCCAYYEQPELIHDMLDTIGAMLVEVCDRVCDRVPVDILRVHEDMAGKSGPLAGPRQIDEFIKPYYRRVWDRLQERGTRLFDQDSDGDMNNVIQSFIDAGVNCMHPIEPAANMDMVKIRETYGTQLAFYGGIDKHVLRRSKQEIEQEIAYKVPPMLESGGCVLALDHRIPNGTPLENYRFYIKTMWEYMN
jgi:uroporphyrinogen-III decarboxylase